MTNIKRVRFSTTIDASIEVVWDTMFDAEGYRRWTAPFGEGSYYEGSWTEGSRILFLAPSGDGMIAEIAENRLHERLSIRHIGMLVGGVEDTESEAVRGWAPAYEIYGFSSVPKGTRIDVDHDIAAGSESSMEDTWSRAFAILKGLCEGDTPS